jgi:hypothetical protein
MTPERRAELEAELDELLGAPPLPKPKVVASDGVIVRDADVHVSKADRRNSRYGLVETVHVRRGDYVTINMAEAERQWWENLRAKEARDAERRAADPCKLGLWGRVDD